MIPIALALTFAAFVQVGVGRTVLATVVDSRNRPLVDLEADDFVVSESGQSRDVLSARMADYPIVVLIDNRAGGQPELDAIRRAARRFISRVGQRPIALGIVGGAPALLASFGDDRSTVLEKLDAIAITTEPSAGPAQLLPGMAAAARAIQTFDLAFSAIVVISASPVAILTESPAEARQQVLDSHAIVDLVLHQSGGAGPADEELRRVADQTHGQLITIYSTASYQIALDHLADQMAAEMMIDYIVPSSASASPKEDVTVGVRVPGARVKGLGVR